MTADRGANNYLYRFDSGNANNAVAAIPHYIDAPAPARTKCVTELTPVWNNDNISGRAFLTFHQNNQPMYFNDGSYLAGGNTLKSLSSAFTNANIGDYVLIQVNAAVFIHGRILSVSGGTDLAIGTPTEILNDSSPIIFGTNNSSLYVIIARRIWEQPNTKLGINQPRPLTRLLNGCRSYAVGIAIEAGNNDAMPLECEVRGYVNYEPTWSN